MINGCPFCNLNTAGDHEWNCPSNLQNKNRLKTSTFTQGWQCPICKSVYAYHVTRCPNHGPEKINPDDYEYHGGGNG